MTLIKRAILALALIAGVIPAFAQAPAPVPALPDTERRISYALTASTCNCSIPFALFGEGTDYANWIEVWVNGTRMDQFGNWSITIPVGSIGTVARPITNASLVFNAAQTGTVQIVGARRPRRISQFSESVGVSARNLNQAFTDIVAQNRETWDKINDVTGRVVQAPPGETLSVLASAASRANSVLGFDALGALKTYNPASAVTGSDSVNFLQAGTGAVSRTVQSELRDTLKGAQFGMVCDGVTDDAPALQRAVTRADEIGNPPIELPVGTCRLNSRIFLNKWAASGTLTVPGLNIVGAAKGTSILDTRVANDYAIAVNGSWKAAFEAQSGMVAQTAGGTLGASGPVGTLGAITPGSLYTNGTYNGVALTGGAGSGATANIVVAGGVVSSVTLVNGGTGYAVGNTLSATAASIGGTGSGFSIPIATMTYYLQITMLDGLDREILVTLPKPISVTNTVSRISLTLPAADTGWRYSIYLGTATQPANYGLAGGVDTVGVFGGQTLFLTALGSGHVVPSDKIAVWQQANLSNFSITNSAATANASGVLYFKVGFANISNVLMKGLTGSGFVVPNYAGDLDGSFVFTVEKSKFDTIAGWCIDAAGLALENSYFSAEKLSLNLCGTLPSGYTQPQNFASSGITISSITQNVTNLVTTSTPHNLTTNDQVWVRSVGGMVQIADGYYRVTVQSPTTFNLKFLEGAVVDTSAYTAYTNGGRVMLAWRPPTATTGSGGIRYMGLISNFKDVGCTQVNNVCIYFTEQGSSDAATLEGIDSENTAGKGIYLAAMAGGQILNSECLSAAVFGATISCAQLGTGFAAGGVQNFQIRNVKVRSDVAPSTAFEQFRNTNYPTTFADSNRIINTTWQSFDAANQTRFSGFNFDAIPSSAVFSISALNTAKLTPIGRGGCVPLHLTATGEWICYKLPSTGITLSMAASAANTTYYFYIYNSAVTSAPVAPVIEFSLGANVPDPSGSGYDVKSGDATRTFIGTARTDAGGNWQTTATQTTQYGCLPGVTTTLPVVINGCNISAPSSVLISGTGRGDANYTILNTDRYVYTTAAFTAPRTWTLPAANSLTAGTTIWVQDSVNGVSSVNTLTISRGGADTINGAGTSLIINNVGGGITFTTDGVSNWGTPVQTVTTGGTGFTSGTSGGIPYFAAATRLASSAALAANGVVVGGGAGVTPATVTAGTNGQLLLGVTGSPPAMATMSQDGTITNAGVLTVTKTNNVAFGSYATISPAPVTNSIAGNVALNNTANYFDGPCAIINGGGACGTAGSATGTWFASGSVNLVDSTGNALMLCKLWDGTTVISSGSLNTTAVGIAMTMHLSGYLASPAGNIRISCRDFTFTTGSMLANNSGNSKDSTVSVYRIQ